LQSEHGLLGVERVDRLHLAVPVAPRVETQLGRRIRRLPQEVECVLDVLGAERLAVVPPHVASEEEDQLAIVLLPRPALGELADDGVHAVCGFSGSKSTRLLKHGIAGHMVEIVALSWMAKPCGRSSRNLSVSQPPDVGASPWQGTLVRITSPARPSAGRNRVILITHLAEPKRQRETQP